MNTLTYATAVAGLITGSISLVLSILNYRRDAYKLAVSLACDAEFTSDNSGNSLSFAYIYVTNVGRRSTYIRFVGLSVRNLDFSPNLLEGDQTKGCKLAEGDAPILIKIPQDHWMFGMYSEHWGEMQAYAVDSAGKRYISTKTRACPSWGKGSGRLPRGYNMQEHVLRVALDRGVNKKKGPN